MGWKGLILAGGAGSRLHPTTGTINKHLLPVYDKPMIFYPLTTLMFAGIREIVLVTAPQHIPAFQALLGDGSRWGLDITYCAQERPGGVAEGLRLARGELAGHCVAMILGDNIFYASGLGALLRRAVAATTGATIFSYEVADPSAFGIVTVDAAGRPVAIEEKPASPASRSAVTGLYLYAPDVIDIAAEIAPSWRGELEITDVNRAYMAQDRLTVMPLGRGVAWLDGGTAEGLFEAAQFVKIMEDRTGLKLSCPEEVALRLGLIGRDGFDALVAAMPASGYRDYLERVSADAFRMGSHAP